LVCRSKFLGKVFLLKQGGLPKKPHYIQTPPGSQKSFFPNKSLFFFNASFQKHGPPFFLGVGESFFWFLGFNCFGPPPPPLRPLLFVMGFDKGFRLVKGPFPFRKISLLWRDKWIMFPK